MPLADAVTHPLAGYGNRADAGRDLTLVQMPVAHHSLAAISSQLVGMVAEEARNLGLHSVRQQRSRAMAQNLCQRIGKGLWLGELDHIMLGHGVSLLRWRSGGFEHPHDTPPYPFKLSRTSAHSSTSSATSNSGIPFDDDLDNGKPLFQGIGSDARAVTGTKGENVGPELNRGFKAFLRMAAFTLALTCIFWIADNTPRFFFGDSQAYLATSLEGYLPGDRSWIYGIAVRWIMRESGSLSSVLLTQAVLYALAISTIGSCVVTITKRDGLGYAYCGLSMIEPINFYYVRHFMTDTPAASFFLISVFFMYKIHNANVRRYTFISYLFGLFVVQLVTMSLRISYIPVLLLLSALPLALSGVKRQLTSPMDRVSLFRLRNGFLVVASTAVAVTTLIVVNGLVNPQIGFALNGRSADFLTALISPALRREVLIDQGFKLDQGAFQALTLSNLDRRDYQIWNPQGLEALLYQQMHALPEAEKKRKIAQLDWAILSDNPLGVAKIFLSQLAIYVNPIEYLRRAREGWFIFNTTFDAGFAEQFVHPLVWEKIERDLPLQSTFSTKYFIATIVVGAAYFISSVLSPIGALLVTAQGRGFYILASAAASGYALSIAVLSLYLVPRFLAPLPGLMFALVLILILKADPETS